MITRTTLCVATSLALIGCSPQESSLPEGYAQDALGRTWHYVGPARDLPWAVPEVPTLRSVSDTAEPASTDDSSNTSEISERSFVFVTDNPDGIWTAWELVLDDPDAVHQLGQEYIESQAPDGVASGADPLAPAYRTILGSDDRTVFSSDYFKPGGTHDDLTAVRRVLTPIGGGQSRQGTGTMLESNKGITAAHMFFDGGDWVATGQPSITYSDSTGTITITRVFLNADYVGSELLAHDWSLFYTAGSVSMGSGLYFTLDTTTGESVGDTVNNIGIVDTTGYLHGSCLIKDVLTQRLAYNCDTEDGHSGGPTYKYVPSNGTRQIVANHAGFGGSWNTGPRITFWLDDIQSGLAALPNGAGTADPYP